MSLIPPFRINIIKKHLNTDSPSILDIGCGSHSSTITKTYFPNCTYSGIDRDINYDNTAEDIAKFDHFYEMDLSEPSFEDVPDDSFDIIIMSHIIEHLENGDDIVKLLIPKLKKGGLFYIEFPCEASTTFPSKPETLNFYDDDTHVRVYSIKELQSIFETNNLFVLQSGKNRRLINILLMPIKITHQKIKLGYVKGGVYWDWYGFADYLIAKKK